MNTDNIDRFVTDFLDGNLKIPSTQELHIKIRNTKRDHKESFLDIKDGKYIVKLGARFPECKIVDIPKGPHTIKVTYWCTTRPVSLYCHPSIKAILETQLIPDKIGFINFIKNKLPKTQDKISLKDIEDFYEQIKQFQKTNLDINILIDNFIKKTNGLGRKAFKLKYYLRPKV